MDRGLLRPRSLATSRCVRPVDAALAKMAKRRLRATKITELTDALTGSSVAITTFPGPNVSGPDRPTQPGDRGSERAHHYRPGVRAAEVIVAEAGPTSATTQPPISPPGSGSAPAAMSPLAPHPPKEVCVTKGRGDLATAAGALGPSPRCPLTQRRRVLVLAEGLAQLDFLVRLEVGGDQLEVGADEPPLDLVRDPARGHQEEG